MAGLFKRKPESERQQALIEATLDCIVEKGIQATTVREVAARAGVTNGLIRHHFKTKGNLIAAAYRSTIELITSTTIAVLRAQQGSPQQRLIKFVEASLGGEAAEYRVFSLWATFVCQARVDPLIAAVRKETNLNLLLATEPLIAEVLEAEHRYVPAETLKDLTILVHAAIDGLWIEKCLKDTNDHRDDFIALGIKAIDSLLKIDLQSISFNAQILPLPNYSEE